MPKNPKLLIQERERPVQMLENHQGEFQNLVATLRSLVA